MTVAESRDRGSDVEDAVSSPWPAYLITRERDGREDWCDIELVHDVGERTGHVVSTAGTSGEVWSSHPDCADRPGRRWIRLGDHERSIAEDETNVLAVAEGHARRTLRMVLVAAPTNEALIDWGW